MMFATLVFDYIDFYIQDPDDDDDFVLRAQFQK